MLVQFQYPITPVVMYDVNNFPFTPMINGIPNEVAHLRQAVASTVANECGKEAYKNPARTYCYNILANMNWQNESFSDVVKNILYFIYIRCSQKIYDNPNTAVVDCVQKYLVMYTSSLILTNNDLKRECTSESIDTAFQNGNPFNALKQEIFTMQQNGNPNGNPNAVYYPQQNQFQPVQNQFQPGCYPNQMPQQQGFMTPNGFVPVQPGYDPRMMYQQNGFQQQPPQMMHPGMMVPNNQAMPSVPFGSNGFNNNNNNNQLSAIDMIRDARFSSTNRPTIPEQVFEQVSNKVEEPNNSDDVPETLSVIQGNEMDRTKHTITFFNQSYSTNSVIRNRQLNESVSKLTTTNTLADNDETNYFVYGTMLFNSNLSNAINSGKLKQYEQQSVNVNSEVFRCFSMIGIPIITTFDSADYFKKLKEAVTFNELAKKITSISLSLEATKENDGEIPGAAEQLDEIVTMLCHFNNEMTNIINEFIKTKLFIKIKINDFTEDISDIYNYLESQYNVNTCEHFKAFESDFMDALCNAGDIQVYLDTLKNDISIPETMFVNFIPVHYSFTYMCMTNKELGFIIKDKPLIIDRHATPILYKLAHSLDRHKKEMQSKTLNDYFITSDGVIYNIYRAFSIGDQFMIERYN